MWSHNETGWCLPYLQRAPWVTARWKPLMRLIVFFLGFWLTLHFCFSSTLKTKKVCLILNSDTSSLWKLSLFPKRPKLSKLSVWNQGTSSDSESKRLHGQEVCYFWSESHSHHCFFWLFCPKKRMISISNTPKLLFSFTEITWKLPVTQTSKKKH